MSRKIRLSISNSDLSSINATKRMRTCRLCGKKGTNLVPIFENNYFIAEKISRCLPVVVLNSDKLSLHICKKCFNLLNITYKFITTAIQVDATLKEQSKKNKVNSTDKMDLKSLKRIASAGPVNCDLCKKKFVDMEMFDYHIEYEHLLLWRCSFCDQSYHTYDELVVHERRKHDDCNESSITADNQTIMSYSDAIMDHIDLIMDTHEIEMSDQAEDIQEEPEDIDNNEQTIDKTRPEEGNDKSEIHSYLEDIEKENELHNSIGSQVKTQINVEASSECSSLSQGLDGKLLVQQSMPKLDRISTRLKCKFCVKSYSSKYYLQRHELNHLQSITNKSQTTVITYACPVCQRKFSEPNNLTSHMRTHSNTEGSCNDEVHR